jgi:hypothetical protein
MRKALAQRRDGGRLPPCCLFYQLAILMEFRSGSVPIGLPCGGDRIAQLPMRRQLLRITS